MKKEYNILRFLKSIVSALCIVLVTASYAFANVVPGPFTVISLFSLVILIVGLTFAGGGYSVAKRLHDAKYPSKVKRTIINTLEFIAGIVLFFIGLMASILGILGFSIYAIARGVKMIKWSKEAEKDGARPAHLEGVSPKKLKIAGNVLIVLTLFLFGYSTFNEVMSLTDEIRRSKAHRVNDYAQEAHTAAKAYLKDNPRAGVVTCADMEKTGYHPSGDVTCFSDMTATSGNIRMTGPEKWKLRKPVAVITFSGELTRAEP